VRNRERTTRDGLDVAAYQDLFASPPCGREGGPGEGRGSPGHGGAYLRVIPEGRTPSAWDPADNVPPVLRYTPGPILGVEVIELTARSDATLPVRMLKSRGSSWGCLKGWTPEDTRGRVVAPKGSFASLDTRSVRFSGQRNIALFLNIDRST